MPQPAPAFPVPTPYQPPKKGGNPYLKPGTTGPMIGPTQVPTSNVNKSGMVSFSGGAQYPAGSILGSRAPIVNQQQQPQQPQQPQQMQPQQMQLQQMQQQPGGMRTPGQGDDVNSAQFSEWRSMQPQEGNMDVNSLIDSQYNEQMGYLGGVEGNLRNDYPNVLADVEANYGAQKGNIDSSRRTAQDTLAGNLTGAETRRAEAEMRNRQAYDEQNRAAFQRFGGGSSAGQASSEILARGQAQDLGAVQQNHNNHVQEIDRNKMQIERDYSTALESLDARKSTAINEANREFQGKLLEITRLKSEAGANKGQQRLQALMDLRNKTFQIDQENTNFMRSLEQQKMSASQDLDTYSKQLEMQMASEQKARGASNSFYDTYAPGQRYQVGNSSFTAQEPVMIGKIGKRVVGKDDLGRTVYEDGTSGYSQYDSFGQPVQPTQAKQQPVVDNKFMGMF